MTTFPTLKVEVAFTGAPLVPSGLTWTDVSADVRSVQTTRGRQRQIEAFAAGTCTIELDNNSGNYDPDNPNSIYTGLAAGQPITHVAPMRPVRVSATWNSVSYTMFYGYADSWTPQYSPGQYSDTWVILTASDAMKYLNNISDPGSSAPGEDAGARVTRILDLVSWDASLRTIATGNVSLPPAAALSASAASDIQSAVDAEFGRWYVGTDGKVIFENRSSRYSTQTSVATWADRDAGVSTSDTFNRADSTTTLGSTDGGTSLTWQYDAPVFGGTPSWGIVSNTAYTPGTGAGLARSPVAYVDIGSGDIDLSVTLATAGNQGGLIFRWSDSANYWFFLNSLIDNVMYLGKRVAGVSTILAGAAGAAGNGVALRVVALGSSITAYSGVTVKATTTDTFNATATKHGLITQNEFVSNSGGDVAVRFDSFSIDSSAVAFPLYAELGRSVDDDLIRNYVTVTRAGGVDQIATDSASIALYGERTFSQSNVLVSADSDAAQLANIYLYTGKYLAGCRFDLIRFEPVTSITAGTSGDLWPEVLGRSISQRVDIRITPPRVTQMTIPAYIEGVSHTITTEPQNWSTSFHLSRAAYTTFMQVGDATVTTYNANAVLGTNTVGY